MIDLEGLPPIVSDGELSVRYNPLTVTRYAWLAERWWWRESSRALDAAVRGAIEQRGAWSDPEWPLIGEIAMHVLLRVGSWGALKQCEWARAHRGRRLRPAVLRTMALAAEPGWDWDPSGPETWEEYKARVFGPLREEVYGVPSQFADSYVATRVPPIRNATQLLRERVRDVIAQARLEDWPDRQLEGALREAGRWPLARVRTQIRTETSTMYNAGRFVYMAGDEAVVAYEYHATIDLRTTEFCRAIDGLRVAQRDLQAVPPFHYNCRTIMVPLFEWEHPATAQPSAIPVPGEGAWSAAQYVGFGQQELVAQFRGG